MLTRKRLAVSAIVALVGGITFSTTAWAAPDVNGIAAGLQENAQQIATGLLGTEDSNISCAGEPDARVVTQATSVGTVSQQATVLITGEGACANLQATGS